VTQVHVLLELLNVRFYEILFPASFFFKLIHSDRLTYMAKLVALLPQLGKSTHRVGNVEANKWLQVPSHCWVCPFAHQPAV
jgi:hypothetical protein